MPANVVESHLRDVAERLGVVANLALMQSYLAADVTSSHGHYVALRQIDFDAHWRLARIHDLIYLAGSVADGRCEATEARARLRALVSAKGLYPRPLVVLTYGIYAAAVAARIGGGLREMSAASVLGLVAGMIHFGTHLSRVIDLQQSFVAGLIGSGVVLALSKFLLGLKLAAALFGGVTLLVPAMVIAIGTHELANGALEAGGRTEVSWQRSSSSARTPPRSCRPSWSPALDTSMPSSFQVGFQQRSSFPGSFS